MELSKCFDTLDHELILKFVRKRITDGSFLNLIKQFLNSGVMIGSMLENIEIGSPQGGVINPLLSNIYLDEFDQEMMRRQHRIVRYADVFTNYIELNGAFYVIFSCIFYTSWN